MTPNTTQLPVALDGQLVYSKFDTGLNVTLVNHKLAEQLGLEMYAYSNTQVLILTHNTHDTDKYS